MPPAGPFHIHLAVAAVLLLSTLLHAASAATPSEVAALMAFKRSLTIPPAADAFFASWNATAATPCSFTGVTCRGSSVVSLSVDDQSVAAASVPFEALCGGLKSLATLSLRCNELAGPIAGVDTCVGLVELTLAFNSFSGEVPDLTPLAGLRTLNLSSNAFSGSFPWSALTAMPGLEVLAAGDIPNLAPTKSFPAEVTALTNLTALYLSAANIVGAIPAGIGRLTKLARLELADNRLSGEIPAAMSKLTNLQSLELYNCSLTGAFPPGFGKLTKLQFFDASQNSLTGGLSELRTLTRLVSLQLFFNGLSGEVPAEFGDFKELVNLSLYSNNLTGELPQKLGSWSDFNFIDVSTNSLTGPIPPDMCKQGTMLKLLMLENRFSGEIPASYASCTTLQRFRVSKNSLSGKVPEGLWALPDVVIIDLEGNQFTGVIGDGIGKAASLTSLLLADNKFSGVIPLSIGDAVNLESIDVSSNELSGEIPATIGNLVRLDSLNIAANGIDGPIPGSLGSCSALSNVNLANNKLAGAIPVELRGLTRLNSLDVSSNELTGAVPEILADLKLSYLNLSDNRLDGPLPPALAISAYGDSFQGNPGLCATNGVGILRSCTPRDGGRSGSTARTLVTCLLASMAVLLAVLGVVIFIKKRRRHAEAAAMAGGKLPLFAKKGSWNVKSFRMVAFDEREIVGGVRDENLIGSGGSGNVYRVKLGSGAVVAVKHITRTRAASSAGPTAAMLPRSASFSARQCREFDAEVGTLSSIRHVNVVKLLCSVTSEDGAASLLVYEHLPNGSLYERLHGPAARKLGGLGWPERYEVAVGAARGLEYLHHGCGDRPILHRDVKSSNILLDEAFKPRIADFGLAKILDDAAAGKGHHEWSSSGGGGVAGTVGYMAPEYAYTRKVTEKSDVYSFGVVLLELVTGRAAVADGEDVVEWACRRLELEQDGSGREKAMGLLDASAAREEWEKEEAVRVLRVAVLCTSRTPAVRPSMRSVVQMLEDAAVGRECSGKLAAVEVKVVVP